MPTFDQLNVPATPPEPLQQFPFKPVTRSHILHCSYPFWHQKYRSSVLRSRIIPLSPAFLEYLRADGIMLPHDAFSFPPSSSYDETFPRSNDSWDEDAGPDPSLLFIDIHQQIKDAIAELGGLVAPKLNWSAPKDATWISMKKNSMECATPNDIYLLLKSSDFITHDLEHAFDDTEDNKAITQADIKYVLVLRKWFKVNPAFEFRCFVRERKTVGICQRDLNHFAFLFALKDLIRNTILDYYEQELEATFPDDDFVFDIYIPEPYNKVRLIDINPWAPRTDPLLFSWLELLTLPLPRPLLGIPDSDANPPLPPASGDEDTQDEDMEDLEWKPEMRLIGKNDPEAYSFASPQYSAHKLPREVVQAGIQGEAGMKEFAEEWAKVLKAETEMKTGNSSDSDDEDADNDANANKQTSTA